MGTQTELQEVFDWFVSSYSAHSQPTRDPMAGCSWIYRSRKKYAGKLSTMGTRTKRQTQSQAQQMMQSGYWDGCMAISSTLAHITMSCATQQV